jgi:hypothetical protein
MYKLWHKLFGWDYVLFKFGSSRIIRRVHTSPTGIKFVKPYAGIYLVGENELYHEWKYLT